MAKDRSWVGKVAEQAWGATKWVAKEAVMPALEKAIPQGAGEVAHALNTGSAFTGATGFRAGSTVFSLAATAVGVFSAAFSALNFSDEVFSVADFSGKVFSALATCAD